jgi:NAD(P)-dependent dehydrogenase (short-subunit alcohol dehydrogenase family)
VRIVLITGASRGIGLEFVSQYAEAGWRVHACCRQPKQAPALTTLAARHRKVSVHALDVLDGSAVARLAAELAGQAIDLLINCAGVFGPMPGREQDLRQMLGHIDYEVMAEVYSTNTLAPLRMAEAFVEHVAASADRKIVNLTSTLGSITAGERGLYAYRCSKAALNMVTATLSRDLAPRGIAVASICPGWVRTDMGGPGADLDVGDSVAGMRQVIETLDVSRSGKFFRYNGESVPW